MEYNKSDLESSIMNPYEIDIALITTYQFKNLGKIWCFNIIKSF